MACPRYPPGEMNTYMKTILTVFPAIGIALTAGGVTPWIEGVDVPVVITIGQSNADGSALADASEDARLSAWYESSDNPGSMKMWYRSSVIQNQPDGARWVMDGTVEDTAPGWLDLWWRNDQTQGKTMMNMIHSFGTWSTGPDKAQGRRGMEAEFGKEFVTSHPDMPLYMIKLGCSGSSIRTWDPELDGHNWNYFVDSVYTPAVSSLLAEGKRPRLAAIWWMQGCADGNSMDQLQYERALRHVIANCRDSLGFPEARFIIGHVVAPGESPDFPKASTQWGPGVRAAQDAVGMPESITHLPGTEILDTRGYGFISDNLHYDHRSINDIGRRLEALVTSAGPDSWDTFVTPGHWVATDTNTPRFIPSIGNPKIVYERTNDGRVIAKLDYGTWTQQIEMPSK